MTNDEALKWLDRWTKCIFWGEDDTEALSVLRSALTPPTDFHAAEMLDLIQSYEPPMTDEEGTFLLRHFNSGGGCSPGCIWCAKISALISAPALAPPDDKERRKLLREMEDAWEKRGDGMRRYQESYDSIFNLVSAPPAPRPKVTIGAVWEALHAYKRGAVDDKFMVEWVRFIGVGVEEKKA